MSRKAYPTTSAHPDLDRLGAFVAVADANGFAAAARRDGTQKATLSRKVRELEARLGVALLRRTSRAIAVTAEGQAYLGPARAALAAAREAEAAVASTQAGLTGTLRVSTTPVLAEWLAERVLPGYLLAHREVAIELDTSPRVRELVRERFDLAIRAGAPADSSMRARRLGAARIAYVASPAYLRRFGEPQSPAALVGHSLLAVSTEEAVTWAFVKRGALVRQLIRPRLSTPSNQVVLTAARAGAGIARVADFHVAADLAAGTLTAVLEAWTPPRSPIVAIMPAGRVAPRTRAFVEAVISGMARTPALRSRS
ncbi:MAG: LysR family transcriptional regulator [Deltaproteobacteria bacterium]|nr:LysR family transcriptional regulator [Deltaproteobacteria bacterium]